MSKVAVVTGFQGIEPSRQRIATLGRGGSSGGPAGPPARAVALCRRLHRAGADQFAVAPHLVDHDAEAVVLADVCMPDLDGYELAAMIRQHPRCQRTSIIFVSAVNVSDLDRLRGYKLGAVDYVMVPIIPEILRSKVMVLAELFRKRSELQALNASLGLATTDRLLVEIAHRLNATLRAEFDAALALPCPTAFVAFTVKV